MNGLGVMAFDEAFAVVPISLAKVQPAGFTRQSTERSQRPLFFGLHQCRIAFVSAMQRSDNLAFLRLLNPIPG